MNVKSLMLGVYWRAARHDAGRVLVYARIMGIEEVLSASAVASVLTSVKIARPEDRKTIFLKEFWFITDIFCS